MANNEIERIARLGRIVKERREELSLSQKQMLDLGGPSNSTLTNLERGKAATVSNATLRKLDRALQWEYGSSQTALNGGEPTPATTQAPDPANFVSVSTETVSQTVAEAQPQVSRLTDTELISELSRRLTDATEMQAWAAKELRASNEREDALEKELAQARAQLEEAE